MRTLAAFLLPCLLIVLVGRAVLTHAEPRDPLPTAKVIKTEAEWRKQLTPAQYKILRQAETEAPGSGKYLNTTQPGSYKCAACGSVLFKSDHKFNSHCGWPSFYTTAAGDRVVQRPDHSHGMNRIEVVCANCGGHLGHVFADAPDQPGGQRYCINSESLIFEPAAPR